MYFKMCVYRKDDIIRNLKDIFDLYSSPCPSVHLEIAMESEIDGDKHCANDHLKELFYEELSELPVEDGIRSLFRFTSIPQTKDTALVDNPVIKDIINSSITLSNPNDFNDPMDPILRGWLKIQEKGKWDKRSKKLFEMAKKILCEIDF